MNTDRPVNLSLITMRFPITAIVSILHRISGVVLFLALPFLLWLLKTSLASASGFQHTQTLLHTCWTLKFALWVSCAALIYHLFAGVRHLFMDLGFAEELCAARCTASVMLLLSVVAMLGLGVYLWAM